MGEDILVADHPVRKLLILITCYIPIKLVYINTHAGQIEEVVDDKQSLHYDYSYSKYVDT